MYSGYTKLYAFEKAELLAHAVFETSKAFPRIEDRSLTDQIRRSSRSVCSNIAESYAKRRYPKHFISKLTDSLGEAYETECWLRFARRCNYINNDTFLDLHGQVIEVNRLLMNMIRNPETFADKFT
ncbi:four helix bundle protein [Lewinella sp. 4G2]|uniref:four helix bundle protein n=1 Tax=Lewinella sp. 4G2 TaxID=1803372 RepID=UPI0007B47E3F|nr:four helix bundle protein [Lewinella sp. 4G2]OAV46000.1 hypothetical protein A3850_019085 [Lewinella sp. 4G2]